MLLALGATLIVIVALLWEVAAPRVTETLAAPSRPAAPVSPIDVYDPGRERRAEQRARQLLRSCVNDEEWDMYRELGFIRVWGAPGRRSRAGRHAGDPRRRAVRLHHLPAQADRRLPAADPRAARRVLRGLPGRDAPLRQRRASPTPTTRWPSGWP